MTAFAGVDTSFFPGLAVMQALKAASNAAWTGYYLRAPSHADPGWMGKRTGLHAQGWGLAPVFVGQQAYGPGGHVLTAGQGTSDGADAADLMRAEGFAPGSFVWLDVEGGGPIGLPFAAYIYAWCGEVAASGWGVGVYGSHLMAGQLSRIWPHARIWAVRTDEPIGPHAYAGGTAFAADGPAGSGYGPAFAWQHEENAIVSFAGHRLQLDLSTALSADPSAP